ncbi:MAG: hypothetical protein WCF33_22955 [Pseudonocardiaceae bacterium]
MSDQPATVSGAREGHPVRSPARWARSPLDYHTHLLLSEGDHLPGVLKARCGALMLSGAPRHDQPPPGLTCADYQMIFLVDSNAWNPQDE